MIKMIRWIFRNAAMLALDSGLVFAALPRVRMGLAELRPTRLRFPLIPQQVIR
jgi:hypothetical protein